MADLAEGARSALGERWIEIAADHVDEVERRLRAAGFQIERDDGLVSAAIGEW